VRAEPTLAESVTSAEASMPSNLVPSAATSRPSTVPSTVILPLTSSPVLFNNFNAEPVSLATITFEPAFLTAYSIRPSSVPSVTSEILPVTLA
jgi:hypothetical protein